MTEHDCPTCGDEFDTVKGMKIHHMHEHGESINGITVECDWCGSETKKSRYQIEQNDHNFCSRECSSQWRTENFTGENNPNWKGGEVDAECAWCETELSIIRAKARNHTVHFCSIECEGNWKSENQRGENAAAWKNATLELDCTNCGDSFERYQSQVNREWRSFCSPECRVEWMIENAEYKLNHGPRWDDKRKRAIKHHGPFCQRCGMLRSDHKERYGMDLHIHHLVNPDEFDDPEEGHEVEKLRPLCASCHGFVERSTGGFPVK